MVIEESSSNLIGQKVIITNNTLGHGYQIGEVVTIEAVVSTNIVRGKERPDMKRGCYLSDKDYTFKHFTNSLASQFLSDK